MVSTATALLFEESFVVSCASCRKSYDAGPAAWCLCVTAKIAVVCPHCGSCVCKASGTAQHSFWLNAP
jgi:hypothetical protein